MQKKDDFDLQDFLPYLLNQAAEECGLGFQKIYKGRYGMLRTEWRVLFHLGTYGRLTATQIGVMAKTHKTKISRAVHKLEKRRFLTRERNEEDRRQEYLALTPAGSDAYRALKQQALDYDRSISKDLSETERTVLLRALRKLAGNN